MTLSPYSPIRERITRTLVSATCLAALSATSARALDDFEYTQPSSKFHFEVKRSEANPIIHRELDGLVGDTGGRNRGNNINGPSLIKVPDWIENPLGRYYLYFAHHHGKHIYLAYADALEGPWKIHQGGVLPLEKTPSYDGRPSDHVASPDVHVDHDQRRIRMYYHADPRPGTPSPYQASYVAVSSDGLDFDPLDEILGMFYFRVFERDGWHYALAKYINDGGVMYRSRDPLGGFEQGRRILPRVRHMALWEHNDMLYVFFSRGGDEPEHIMVSRIENPDDDWQEWRFTEPQTVLKPEKDYEGVDQPIEPSRFGATYDFVHQLRDPAIYEEDGRLYLIYSAAGEWSLALAELEFREWLLTALFVDCDSYFASVEQHLDPALRGRPVGVAPVMAESSCCIAASYEAKAFGVKTGTRISDARVLCPGIAIVESKPAEYIRYHHQVLAAVEDCIHVEAVLSIDEMWAWLPYNLREPRTVEAIGRRIKETVARDVSPVIKVSVGAGPNRYLAKTASKMKKPDGLFIIGHQDLPQVLHPLRLRDLNGIARSMETRLHAHGIHTVPELCAAPKPLLHRVWGGVLGDRLWHLLRGDEIPDLVSARKSIGHSHVLPPESRHPDKAWPVLCKLLHKACERLRSHGLLAGALTMQVAFLRGVSWVAEARTEATDSTLLFMRLLDRLWRERPEPRCQLLQVGVVLTRLCERTNHTPSLFQTVTDTMACFDSDKQRRLDETIDRLRARYGRKVVYFGNVQESRDTAPMRISFTHIPDLELEQD